MSKRGETRTGGRAATTGVIPGRYALSVGNPGTAAPPGWQWTPLSEVARLETGHTPSRRHPEYWDGGIPWIGIRDATENHGRMIATTIQNISQLGLDNSSARLLPTNTVCLSRTASVGFVVMMGAPMATSQDFVNWVCSERLDPRFLKYVLLAEHETFHRFSSGTTHQTIYFPEAKAFHVCLPPIELQLDISTTLGALDDKIELNHRMSETLESMSRALFRSWFVDFDPVRAKAEGRITGLPEDLADLFPDSFEESELGEIPKGWRVSTIGDIAAAIDCLHSKKPARQSTGRPFLQLHNIRNDGLLDLTDSYLIDEADYEKWVSRIEAAEGDCVITNVGRVGAVAQVPSGARAALGRNMTAIRCAPSFPFPTWLLECLRSDAMRTEIVRKTDAGTILDALNVRNIPRLRIVLPDTIDLVTAFEERSRPLRAKMEALMGESGTLAALRDTLLPRLISGKIPVNTVRSPH